MMSSRSRFDEDTTSTTKKSKIKEGSRGKAGEFKDDQGAYEAEIKDYQGELKALSDLEAKQAKSIQEGKEGLTEKEEEKIRNSNEERSRINNAMAQLRSEASRKGLRLTV
jgi:hypothetical protein